ncbi:uncharacterized protein LOC119105582 [Pollicipes pollicipes]|uniref:uncharacterized protein LOC119105582 n=1 Tax=Pollicipes pollicipes TaxID=41117 RepID=UPI001884C272|nr:uncharacterized protein LOC119105582 [Pollicipes pollicipes]
MAGSDMSVDDIYERLRLSFPFVHVRRADARDTPELARLLLSLARHVDETGVSRSVASELQTEQRRLAQQLHGYHATRLLHTLLEEMATGLSAAGDHTDHQLREAVREGLSLAELHDALPLAAPAADGRAREHALLELTEDELAPSAEHRQTLGRLPRTRSRTRSG